MPAAADRSRDSTSLRRIPCATTPDRGPVHPACGRTGHTPDGCRGRLRRPAAVDGLVAALGLGGLVEGLLGLAPVPEHRGPHLPAVARSRAGGIRQEEMSTVRKVEKSLPSRSWTPRICGPVAHQRQLPAAMLAADASALHVYYVDDHFVPYEGVNVSAGAQQGKAKGVAVCGNLRASS